MVFIPFAIFLCWRSKIVGLGVSYSISEEGVKGVGGLELLLLLLTLLPLPLLGLDNGRVHLVASLLLQCRIFRNAV